MDTALRIRQRVLDELIAHAREAGPDECCGLIIGTADLAERSVRARNLRESPGRYLIDPADHFAAIRTARADGLSVIGAYHSHPASPPLPSERDVAEATSPTFVYLIVGPGGQDVPPAVRAFHLAPGRVEAIALIPVG
jgi:proteasome lid subunit RPN8/RPN11